ncbi:hypothetical protein Baya_5827 [Bagarius yarrelli]|uniref:Uncharacterized protein n=1 Tax=Bagarius yarrelli TaxID=175774 RepID=A0A556TYL4_BAGYA|nr:hypothetical protein Baya_5827 [Bagarius yarrelli]
MTFVINQAAMYWDSRGGDGDYDSMAEGACSQEEGRDAGKDQELHLLADRLAAPQHLLA